MDRVEDAKKLSPKCLENMNAFQIPQNIREFCLDAVNLEHEISSVSFRVKKTIKESSSSATPPSSSSAPPSSSSSSSSLSSLSSSSSPVDRSIIERRIDSLYSVVETTVKTFKSLNERLGVIESKVTSLPPLTVKSTGLSSLRAPCSLKYQDKYKCPNLPDQSNGPKTSKDLKILRKLILRLEYDYAKPTAALTSDKVKGTPGKVKGTGDDDEDGDNYVIHEEDVQMVSKLSRAYRGYLTFEKMFKAFRSKSDDGKKSRPICIFDRLAEFKSQISLDEAIQYGILDVNHGLYVDPMTKATRPIPTAMSEGLIRVEAVTETASKPKVEELGMITVKSLVGEDTTKEYRLLGAIDPLTAERLTVEEATKRGWLRKEKFKIGDDDEIPIEEAVEVGWIQAEIVRKQNADSLDANEYETRNYLVRAVVDTQSKKTITFSEAVQLGIIDIDHGCFVDSRGGERVSIGEALKRGFIKGRLVDEGEDQSVLTLSPANIVVARNLGKLKNVVGAINALAKNKVSNIYAADTKGDVRCDEDSSNSNNNNNNSNNNNNNNNITKDSINVKDDSAKKLSQAMLETKSDSEEKTSVVDTATSATTPITTAASTTTATSATTAFAVVASAVATRITVTSTTVNTSTSATATSSTATATTSSAAATTNNMNTSTSSNNNNSNSSYNNNNSNTVSLAEVSKDGDKNVENVECSTKAQKVTGFFKSKKKSDRKKK
ncbi:hypothetical protein HELRODRAFT_193942 [Helobdella robusta]|uniref:Uncharacterized protein n=1 Tax=Helobdella robusta TaxID=6412 RepID=T1FVI2_HELRO|nr:hypothetical protein HELRODRAFT_193942 [Helobdella robusta]ESN93740.1 hypothetical protein HELRODRAFT_193942 [Helobdella robusta]